MRSAGAASASDEYPKERAAPASGRHIAATRHVRSRAPSGIRSRASLPPNSRPRAEIHLASRPVVRHPGDARGSDRLRSREMNPGFTRRGGKMGITERMGTRPCRWRREHGLRSQATPSLDGTDEICFDKQA